MDLNALEMLELCLKYCYMENFLEIGFVGWEFRPVTRGNFVKIFSKSLPKFHYGPKILPIFAILF